MEQTNVEPIENGEQSPDEKWTILSKTEFDGVVAKIIMNPQITVQELDDVWIKREHDGSTLLHVVAGWNNYHQIVERLLKAGLPPDVRDTSGWTPLLEAAQEGQIATCQVLIANGATPDLALADLTPLRAAAEVGNEATTQWLMQQPGTWSHKWENEFFAFLLAKTPTVALKYLDAFAAVLNHSKQGHVAVKYTDLRLIYGEPIVRVEDTALAVVIKSTNARDILSHRVMKYMMKAKWKGFACTMFRKEFSVYCLLLIAYFIPTVWADPDWIHINSNFDIFVAISRSISWVCSVYLLIYVELNEYRGETARNYFRSFWNVVNLITYVAIMVSIPLEFLSSMEDVRNCILALILVCLWVNLLQFLQVFMESGLLIAMMSQMVKDVYRFFLLYVVFLFGFTGAFYILLRGKEGYNSFTSAFITVFLMLYGQITYDIFDVAEGWTWYMSNFLLFVHLMSVVIVLLNILIAMMATTYSNVWDAAEAEALKSHAKAIIRMEKSLPKKERERIFNQLIVPAEDEDKSSFASEIRRRTTIFAQSNSATRLALRSTAKRGMILDIITKLKSLPLYPGMLRNALRNQPATVEAVHPTSSSTIAKKPLALSKFKPIKVINQPIHFIESLIETHSLTALEQTLTLKSALDYDNANASNSSIGKKLGILEDGIRYELPEKKTTNGDSSTSVASVAELQAQIEKLNQKMGDLQSLLNQVISGTSG